MPRGGRRPGAGRPKQYEDPIDVRFRPETLALIDSYAALRGIGTSEAVRSIVDAYFDRLRAEAEQKVDRMAAEGWSEASKALRDPNVRAEAILEDMARGDGRDIEID